MGPYIKSARKSVKPYLKHVDAFARQSLVTINTKLAQLSKHPQVAKGHSHKSGVMQEFCCDL